MPPKITQEKITQIIELREFGCTFNNICKITKSSKRTVQRICNSNIKKLEYQPTKIPENMKETQYSGYYVSEDGKVWTEFNKYTGKKDILREVNQHPRGGTNINDRYMSVNISIKDENGKFIKRILYYTHRLIAETLISNPNNYKEIDHIDRDKLNNHISNLEWCNRLHNMRWSTQKNAKYFKITDTITNKIYEGENLQKFVRENWEWISKRTKITDIRKYTRNLLGKYKISSHVNGFILER